MNDVSIHSLGSEVMESSLIRIQQFLYHEARLLDLGRFDEWLDLFADDGLYWIPSIRNQTDPLNTPSIIYDNKDLLSMRVRRLGDPRTYQTVPPPHTTHMVGNVLLDGDSTKGPEITVYSTIFVHEYREEARRLFSAQCTHILRNTADGLKITSKRIDLVDCDAVHVAFMSLL